MSNSKNVERINEDTILIASAPSDYGEKKIKEQSDYYKSINETIKKQLEKINQSRKTK